jgi:hypothetical protein
MFISIKEPTVLGSVQSIAVHSSRALAGTPITISNVPLSWGRSRPTGRQFRIRPSHFDV